MKSHQYIKSKNIFHIFSKKKKKKRIYLRLISYRQTLTPRMEGREGERCKKILDNKQIKAKPKYKINLNEQKSHII
jgi:hypothetical protein